MALFAILLLLCLSSVGKCRHDLWDCDAELPIDPPEFTQERFCTDDSCPYRIMISPLTPNLYQVELRGNFNASYTDFILQARRAHEGYGSEYDPVGRFETVLTPYDTELLDCGSGVQNTWRHIFGENTTVEVKYNRIIRWIPPTYYTGPIIFRATVGLAEVNETFIYWSGIESEPLDSFGDLECYECYYSETNGIPDPDRDNKDVCHYFPWNARTVSCIDQETPEPGHVYRCYTSEWRRISSNGDVVLGIRRGCITVELEEYGPTTSTSDIDDIQEIFDFSLAAGETQSGAADLCYSPLCNNNIGDLHCYQCSYEETNGVPEFQYDPNKYNCFYDPHLVETESCADEGPLLPGYVHRCYTSVYRKITRYGDYVQGVRRGCISINAARYGSIYTTSNIQDVEEIFDFELLPGDEQKGTADLCVADFCNDVPAELSCYQCDYTETNGVADADSDDREACYYYPQLTPVVNCHDEEGPLGLGEIYRCYSIQYHKTTLYGDIVEAVRRGCVAVSRTYYGTLRSASHIDYIQDIFDFTLPDGDVQTGTATFCDVEECNDDAAGLQCHSCYYQEDNGVRDSGSDSSREECLSYPASSINLINCLDTVPLETGQVHRCYTTEFDRTNGDGSTRYGIGRGCVAVDEDKYGDLPWTTDLYTIQDIFWDFGLGPNDRQIGTTDLCDWDGCNDEYLFAPIWNAWGPYEEYCSRSCGGGKQTRYRTCNDPRPDDVFFCHGPSTDSIDCNTQPCEPDDAYWSEWGFWGLCSVTCGSGGSYTRNRFCIDPLAITSDRCIGEDSERRSCTGPSCPYQVWGPWSSWSSCSEPCGGGERRRLRDCNDANIPHRCEGRSDESQACNPQHCDDDGKDSNVLLVIGIILGVTAVLIIVILLIVCCCVGLLRGPHVNAPRPWYKRTMYYVRR